MPGIDIVKDEAHEITGKDAGKVGFVVYSELTSPKQWQRRRGIQGIVRSSF